MKDIDITPKLVEKFGKKYLKIGRYSVSGIYAIKAGWTKPEHYFTEQTNDFESILRMYSGVLNHNFLEGLFEKERCEVKVEYPYKDIVVVGKYDYSPNNDELWDFKTSDSVMAKAKPWQEHQIKMYLTMFDKKVGKLYQPVIRGDKVILKLLSTVERDDAWFNKEIEYLYSFHQKLVEMKNNKK